MTVEEISHMADQEIPQVADAPGGFLLYTETEYQGCTQSKSEETSMRILLADTRPKVRFALRVLLDRQPGLEVVGETIDAQGLLAWTEAECPDVLLLDWELAGSAAADLLLALRGICPDLSVIVLSGRPEVRRAALMAGADVFVSKTDPPERLLAAIAGCEAGSKGGHRRGQVRKVTDSWGQGHR
jgi:DNA-binding NarL/FixJ family response regulator